MLKIWELPDLRCSVIWMETQIQCADTIQLFADRLNIPVEILVGGFKPEYAKTIDDLPELLVDLHSHLKSMSEVSYKLHLTCDALGRNIIR
ncbi:MAG: hypothetical protein ACLRYB_18385 [Segatella copri]